MSRLLMNPKHWRDRAEDARARASQLDDPTAQKTMHDIAAGYDRMAELADARVANSNKEASGAG